MNLMFRFAHLNILPSRLIHFNFDAADGSGILGYDGQAFLITHLNHEILIFSYSDHEQRLLGTR